MAKIDLKESRLSFENDGVVKWQTLLGTTVTKEDLENATRGALTEGGGEREKELGARR